MKPLKNILYVSEGAAPQDAAIAQAVSLAAANQARLTCVDFVTVRSDGISSLSDSQTKADYVGRQIEAREQALKQRLAPHDEECEIRFKILQGDNKFLEVIKTVQSEDFDLVIKPVEDPDWIDRLFGSEDMHLMRKCPCPVWLMTESEPTDYKNIVAAIDFDIHDPDAEETTLNELILDFALSLAVGHMARLHVVHAWEVPEAMFVQDYAERPEAAAREMMEAAQPRHAAGTQAFMKGLKSRAGAESYDYVSPIVHLPQGPAHRQIPALAKSISADIVVMGTVARTGIPGLFIGNTAEAILDQLKCSLVALKPPGFESPVVSS